MISAVVLLLAWLAALAPAHARDARIDVGARAQAFRAALDEFSARPSASDLAKPCAKGEEDTIERCFEPLTAWGSRALSLEQTDAAIAYFYRALKLALGRADTRIEAANAWAHWSLALSDKYLSKDLADAPEVVAAIEDLGDERFSPGFATPDRSLLRVFRAIESQWLFYRRGWTLNELQETADLPAALRPMIEIPLLTKNARIHFAKGDFAALDDVLEQLRRLCDAQDYASDQCLGAAYNGLVLSFFQGRDSEVPAWRDRLLQALAASPISDRRFAFVLAALGLADFVAGETARGAVNFEAAIAHQALIGGEPDRDLNMMLSSYAAALAENGNYAGALAISGLTATSSGFMESGSRYARLLSQFMLGDQRIDLEYEYQTCETFWDVKTCLLLWDFYLDQLVAVRTEQGLPILPMMNGVRTTEDFVRLGLSKPKIDEFGKARSDLEQIVSLMAESNFPIARVPLLDASRALRAGRYQWVEDRDDEALETLLAARRTVRGNGLEDETVSIETDSLLSRMKRADGCVAEAYAYSKSALRSIRDRQQQKREYDASSVNEIRNHSPKIRDFIAISFDMLNRPASPAPCG